MILVYRFEDDGFVIEFSKCQDSCQAVDHLHFSLDYAAGKFYQEHIEGVVYMYEGDTEQTLAEKVMRLYVDQMAIMAKDGIKNGLYTLQ